MNGLLSYVRTGLQRAWAGLERLGEWALLGLCWLLESWGRD